MYQLHSKIELFITKVRNSKLKCQQLSSKLLSCNSIGIGISICSSLCTIHAPALVTALFLGPVNAQANMMAQIALVAAKRELVLVLKSLIAYERLAFIDSQYC